MSTQRTDEQKLHKEHIAELKRAVKYYKELSDEVAGYNVLVDSKTIILKNELEKKRLGHNLLRKLHDIVGSTFNLESFFNSTLELILTTWNLDRIIVLWNAKGNSDGLTGNWHRGYSEEEILNTLDDTAVYPYLQSMENTSFLINGTTRKTELHSQICEALQLPFMVGAPIMHEGVVVGWLIGGREKEALPFYPPLQNSDVETFEILSSFISATTYNYKLYANLEKANFRLANYNKELEIKVKERTKNLELSRKELEKEKEKSDQLLLNILPAEVAEELKNTGKSKAKSFDLVTIMFTDFQNFTSMAESVSANKLVNELNICFTKFDEIANKYGIEKIKTIGDAYMAVGGLNKEIPNFTESIILAGLEMQQFMRERSQKLHGFQDDLHMRVGIHSGPVVAGIVGLNKFQYDIWGDSVNLASRMEGAAPVGAVNISKTTYDLVKDNEHFDFTHRGKINIKGKDPVDMWLVEMRES